MAFYANLEFFLGQREALAKELGESSRPMQFLTISLGPLSTSPAQSISMKELVSYPPCLSDVSCLVACEFSTDSLNRVAVVHTLVFAAYKRKLVDGQSLMGNG